MSEHLIDPFEKVIKILNKNLLEEHKKLFVDNKQDKVSIHIIGAPRSGTTLLSQTIVSLTNIGYINNLIAAFYNVPLFGVVLSKKLLNEKYQSNLMSTFGRTEVITEPHEFGRFWLNILGYKDMLQQTYNKNHKINWKDLSEIIYQLNLMFGTPILFKSFLFGFHAKKTIEKMPKTIFIHISRNLFQNAYSILKLRTKMYGSIEKWSSIKPHQYRFIKNKNPYYQVIGQVKFLNYEYNKQLQDISDSNKIVISYEKFCDNYMGVVEELQNKVKINGEEIKITSESNLKVKPHEDIIPKHILEKFEEANLYFDKKYPELQWKF
ncbi:MAG: hypothetical protein GY932_13505 [Arcobacter sp.]|nr:hypothetical protein [Arcobacter sp.]